MDNKNLEKQSDVPEEPQDTRSAWQRNKEELYDKVPLSLRQLDVIIFLGLLGLGIVAVLIVLEAAGIFSI